MAAASGPAGGQIVWASPGAETRFVVIMVILVIFLFLWYHWKHNSSKE